MRDESVIETDIKKHVVHCLRPDTGRTTNEVALISGLPPSVVGRWLYRLLAEGRVSLTPTMLFATQRWTLYDATCRN